MLGRMLRRTAGVLGGVLLACDGSRECLTPAAADSGAPSGAVVWQEAFTATESDIGKAIAVDACDGRVAVGGSVRPRVVNGDADLWIGALSLGFDGRVLREAGLVEGPNDLALGLGGDVYLVGDRNLGGSEWFPCVTRLDRDFARVWEYVHARPGLARSVAVGPSGDAFVTGRVEAPPVDGASELPNYDVWIARFAR